MKWSKYNIIVENGNGQYLLYNCVDDKLMVCVEEVKKLLENNIDHVDVIANIHPDLYQYLVNKTFIVENDVNEAEQYIDNLRKSDQSAEHLSITINPTLNCNLRCWYCYEKHRVETSISSAVKESIEKLVNRRIEEGLKDLFISFFGGEPLLEFDTFVYPFLISMKEKCDKNQIHLSIGFTTNAVLFTPERSAMLKKLNAPIHLQIPFDGSKELHDKIKKQEDGTGTYEIIMSNMRFILASGYNVLIRCNYTNTNIDSFSKLIKDMNRIGKDYPNLVSFSFQAIWQEKESEETKDKLQQIYKEMKSNLVEFNVSTLSQRCYSEKENHIVINYNGDIYKCTARDFVPELREGVLQQDGTITYNERYADRMETKYGWIYCRDCIIMPICNICSQVRLESLQENICLQGDLTDDKKRSIMIDRIRDLNVSKIISY